MCEQCNELVKKYYPNLPEDDYGHLLMSATCFPFGGPKYIEPQLKELVENTDGSLGAAIAFADKQLSKAWEEYRPRRVAMENIQEQSFF